MGGAGAHQCALTPAERSDREHADGSGLGGQAVPGDMAGVCGWGNGGGKGQKGGNDLDVAGGGSLRNYGLCIISSGADRVVSDVLAAEL